MDLIKTKLLYGLGSNHDLNYREPLVKRPRKILKIQLQSTVKPVLSRHSKIDKTKILMTNDRSKVMQDAPFGAFCNTFDLL